MKQSRGLRLIRYHTHLPCMSMQLLTRAAREDVTVDEREDVIWRRVIGAEDGGFRGREFFCCFFFGVGVGGERSIIF